MTVLPAAVGLGADGYTLLSRPSFSGGHLGGFATESGATSAVGTFRWGSSSAPVPSLVPDLCHRMVLEGLIGVEEERGQAAGQAGEGTSAHGIPFGVGGEGSWISGVGAVEEASRLLRRALECLEDEEMAGKLSGKAARSCDEPSCLEVSKSDSIL